MLRSKDGRAFAATAKMCMSWNLAFVEFHDMFAGLMGDVWIKCVAQLKGRSKPPLHCLDEPSGGGR